MDSFYEQPRTVPIPTPIENVPAVPVVPEVSMVFQNHQKGSQSELENMCLSYKAWKSQRQMNNPMQQVQFDKSADCLAKQVRFESSVTPQQQQKKCDAPNNKPAPLKANALPKPFEQIYMANIPNRQLDLSMIEPLKTNVVQKENLENIDPVKNLSNDHLQVYEKPSQQVCYIPNKKSEQSKNVFNLNKNENNQTGVQRDIKLDENDPFEKNRIIDLYNYRCRNFESSETTKYRHILDNAISATNENSADLQGEHNKMTMRMNAPSSNLFDYRCCENETNKHICNCTNNRKSPLGARTNIAIQTENTKLKETNQTNDGPTVKDLLKIIQQQNDQLLILQKQVAALLNMKDKPKPIEATPFAKRNVNVFGEECRTSTQLETQPGLCKPLQNCFPQKGPLPQFSLDVMTSFEVSIRRQQNLNRAFKDAMSHQPRICEVTETDSNEFSQTRGAANAANGLCNKAGSDDNMKVSLTLNEPVQVRETCPTPEHTVRIDMEEYVSDSDDEGSPNNDWLYRNVKDQVDHILRKSGIWHDNPAPNVGAADKDKVSQNVKKKVKEATIKHLKSVGVHVPALEDTNNESNYGTDPFSNQHCDSNQISFVVKQLLMKYLPNEQLTKLAYMQTENVVPANYGKPMGLIKRRPEFSFATVQYMQKYNLLTDTNQNGFKSNQPATVAQPGDNFDRILDITAIRQQPKLL